MHKTSYLTALFCGIYLNLVACSQPAHHQHVHKVHEKVYHLKSGGWTFEAPDGAWYIYQMIGDPGATASRPAMSIPGLPSGGAWVRGAAPSKGELEEAQELETDVEVTEAGDVATEADVAADAGDAGAGSDGGGGDGGGGGGDGGE
jgi:hypothetical protein